MCCGSKSPTRFPVVRLWDNVTLVARVVFVIVDVTGDLKQHTTIEPFQNGLNTIKLINPFGMAGGPALGTWEIF